MDMDEIIAAVEDLEIDDLANLVDDLPNTVIDQLLQSMDGESRKRLEQALSYPEDSVGRLMNPDTITVHADVNVDMVLGQLRLRAELRDHTDHLYVVSHHHQYLGRVSLATLVTHQPDTLINRLIDNEQPAINIKEHAQEVARQFSYHDGLSAPVVNENNALLGHITIDDIVDIIREQAEHQAMSAAGLSNVENMFSPLLWLGINLCTAFITVNVVSEFEYTIENW